MYIVIKLFDQANENTDRIIIQRTYSREIIILSRKVYTTESLSQHNWSPRLVILKVLIICQVQTKDVKL